MAAFALPTVLMMGVAGAVADRVDPAWCCWSRPASRSSRARAWRSCPAAGDVCWSASSAARRWPTPPGAPWSRASSATTRSAGSSRCSRACSRSRPSPVRRSPASWSARTAAPRRSGWTRRRSAGCWSPRPWSAPAAGGARRRGREPPPATADAGRSACAAPGPAGLARLRLDRPRSSSCSRASTSSRCSWCGTTSVRARRRTACSRRSSAPAPSSARGGPGAAAPTGAGAAPARRPGRYGGGDRPGRDLAHGGVPGGVAGPARRVSNGAVNATLGPLYVLRTPEAERGRVLAAVTGVSRTGSVLALGLGGLVGGVLGARRDLRARRWARAAGRRRAGVVAARRRADRTGRDGLEPALAT